MVGRYSPRYRPHVFKKTPLSYLQQQSPPGRDWSNTAPTYRNPISALRTPCSSSARPVRRLVAATVQAAHDLPRARAERIVEDGELARSIWRRGLLESTRVGRSDLRPACYGMRMVGLSWSSASHNSKASLFSPIPKYLSTYSH